MIIKAGEYMKKKIISLILIALTVMCLCITASAVSYDASVSASVSVQEISEGAEVTVTLDLDTGYRLLRSIGIKVGFESDSLTLLSAVSLVENAAVEWYDEENNNLAVMLESEQKYRGGVLCLTFKVKSSDVKTTTVTFTPSLKNKNSTLTCAQCSVDLSLKGHVPNDAVFENVTAAGCVTAGKYDIVTYCLICQKELSRSTMTINPSGHDWNNGHITQDATCTEPGTTVYTCKNDPSHTYTETIEPTGHNYGLSEWVWQNGYGSVQAVLVCSLCQNSVTVDAKITKNEDKGVITYTAYAEFEQMVYGPDTKTEYVEYTVIFKNFDGTVLSEEIYRYGDNVTVPNDPCREEDEEYTYSFKGWDKEIASVTCNAVYTAVFDKNEKIPPFIPGDVNNDKKINNKDVVTLFRYVSGTVTEVNTAALDINGDGKINNKDVVLLFRYISGSDVVISEKPYIIK